MTRFINFSPSAEMRRITNAIVGLILVTMFSSAAYAGPITHYRMDNLINPSLGSFLTFSVNDENKDGIASHDEIFDFSGIEILICNGCNFTRFTHIAEVDLDFVFGGSGEAFFDLRTLNWTYDVINGLGDVVATLPHDFALSLELPDGRLLGSPQRLFNVGPSGDGGPIWRTTRVPEPNIVALLLMGLGGLVVVRRKNRIG